MHIPHIKHSIYSRIAIIRTRKNLFLLQDDEMTRMTDQVFIPVHKLIGPLKMKLSLRIITKIETITYSYLATVLMRFKITMLANLVLQHRGNRRNLQLSNSGHRSNRCLNLLPIRLEIIFHPSKRSRFIRL